MFSSCFREAKIRNGAEIPRLRPRIMKSMKSGGHQEWRKSAVNCAEPRKDDW